MEHIIREVIMACLEAGIKREVRLRRDLHVRRGRRLQRALRLPECMCVFAEEDPGVMDTDLEIAFLCWFSGAWFILFELIAMFARRAIWDPMVLGCGLFAPVFCFGTAWLVLRCGKRSLERKHNPLVDCENGNENDYCQSRTELKSYGSI